MAVEPIAPETLHGICDVLADTNKGFTGSVITELLNQLDISSLEPGATKRQQLYITLLLRQQAEMSGQIVLNFIESAMEPRRYASSKELMKVFEDRRENLNRVLALSGYTLDKSGKLSISHTVSTLDEAEERASSLYSKLEHRGTHQDVLNYCRAELLVENYFHAVFEATKSVADKIRDKAGLTGDGSSLVDAAFGGTTPRLAINALDSETYKSEQSGFLNLLKGIFGMFRNTTAHAPKIKWPIYEQDALDLMSLISYVHRRLDEAKVLL